MSVYPLWGAWQPWERENITSFFPMGQLRQEPSADKWSYKSACNFCTLAKLIMTCQGIFREFIFETTLWKRLQPCCAVERAVRLWFESSPSRVYSAPILQHGFDKTLPLEGLSFLTNQLKQLIPTPLSSLQPHIRSLHKTEARPHQGSGWICFSADTAFIS